MRGERSVWRDRKKIIKLLEAELGRTWPGVGALGKGVMWKSLLSRVCCPGAAIILLR